MNKYITCFDIETTGLSDKEDYIIQLAMVKVDSNTFDEVDERNWYIKPVHNYIIKEGAFEAHGLTKEFIEENGVNLADIADEIIEFVQDSDYLTYNGNSFDVRFLYKDLKIVGRDFPMKDKTFYDAFLLYKHLHPCTLVSVYKNLTGKELEDAHNAYADVNATIEVFKALKVESEYTLEQLADMKENQLLSPEGSVRCVHQGEIDNIVFTIGKYRDAEVYEVLEKDPSYIKWWANNVATEYTKNIVRNYIISRKNSKKSV